MSQAETIAAWLWRHHPLTAGWLGVPGRLGVGVSPRPLLDHPRHQAVEPVTAVGSPPKGRDMGITLRPGVAPFVGGEHGAVGGSAPAMQDRPQAMHGRPPAMQDRPPAVQSLDAEAEMFDQAASAHEQQRERVRRAIANGVSDWSLWAVQQRMPLREVFRLAGEIRRETVE